MEKFIVTKEISIEYGHRVPNHKSKCRAMHGHSGLVRAHVCGPLIKTTGISEEGMVCDFSDIKKILVDVVDGIFDHSFITCVQDTVLLCTLFGEGARVSYINQANVNGLVSLQNSHPLFSKLVILPCVPTAENLAATILKLVNQDLPALLNCCKVEFWETKTSCAIIEA